MNIVLEKLKKWNCDINGAMERFLDDEDMYMDFLKEVAEDPALVRLKSNIDIGDAKAAFECAHTLKGVYGNMGLTPLYNLTIEIVEPLRNGSFEGIEAKYEELFKLNEKFKTYLG